jgi:hypothetical protein
MESHGLHGYGIYYEAGDRIWVNLYTSSTANWRSGGVKLATDTDFPEGETATIHVTAQRPKQFTLLLRRPYWAGKGFALKVNGVDVKEVSTPGSYIELKRRWKTGDTVSLILPKTLHEEPTPDNKHRAALMWGPLVLAGDLGPERRGAPLDPIPSFVGGDRPVDEWLQPVAGEPGEFHTVGVSRDLTNAEREMSFVPFYRLHRRQYALYWDIYTAAEWKKRLEAVAVEKARQQKIESSTIAFVQPGNLETEKSFNQQGEETTRDSTQGRSARRGKKWFSYEMAIDSAQPTSVLVTYFNEERGKRTFEILIDGQHIGEQTIERSPNGSAAGHFFDVEYKIPEDVVKNKKKLTVRFQATSGNEIAAIYGVRLIRAIEQH